jgi:hypothetical protein
MSLTVVPPATPEGLLHCAVVEDVTNTQYCLVPSALYLGGFKIMCWQCSSTSGWSGEREKGGSYAKRLRVDLKRGVMGRAPW